MVMTFSPVSTQFDNRTSRMTGSGFVAWARLFETIPNNKAVTHSNRFSDIAYPPTELKIDFVDTLPDIPCLLQKLFAIGGKFTVRENSMKLVTAALVVLPA